jgi:tight adherence protein C
MNFTEWAALSGVFVSVLMVVSLLMTVATKRIKSDKRAQAHTRQDDVAEILAINQYFSIDQEQYNHYFSLTNNTNTDEVAMRLLRCGFLSVKAKFYLNTIRTSLVVITALATGIVAVTSGKDYQVGMVFAFSTIGAGIMYILVGVVLDKLEKNSMRQSRKLLPDLLDLLIVCIDAGISLNAAFERVSQEFAVTNSNFSFHLVILTLEARAGRPMGAAMSNLAQRLQVQEFRTLAILFKQSERMGASVNDTLRTYSQEMREKRLLLAEEKANALPVKMLLPMAVFIFPANLMIVIAPVMMNLMVMFSDFNN